MQKNKLLPKALFPRLFHKVKKALPKADFSQPPFGKPSQTKGLQGLAKLCFARRLAKKREKFPQGLPRGRFSQTFSQKVFCNSKRLLPGIFAIGLAAWIEADKALAIADLHLGIEEEFNKKGVFLPRFNFNKIKKHLEKKVFPVVSPELIIVNGDLKHEFGTVSEQEWREVIDMLRFLQSKCKRLVLVQGNHDTVLGPIAKWEKLSIEKDGILLPKSKAFATHGEKIPESNEFKKAKIILIGHEHPAIAIREQYKQEQFKCFLVGKFRGKNLIVQPSMNSTAIGTEVRGKKLLSPFLQQPLGNFKVFAVADKVYNFGKLSQLE